MDKWPRRFLNLAKLVATWSKDPSTQVGAVVVDDTKRVVGIGFNGFARGIKDDDIFLKDRHAKLARMIHAEINAILNASAAVQDCTIYLTIPPCSACASFLIQSGIKHVVYLKPSDELIQRWGDSWQLSYSLLDEANVSRTEYPKDDI